MMRKFGFILGLFWLCVPIATRAATCDAGDYLDTNTDTCVPCGGGQYYCPGDNIRYNCPSATGHLMSDWPENYRNPVLDAAYVYIEGGESYKRHSSIVSCQLRYDLHNDYGEIYDIRFFNPSTNLYDMVYSQPHSWGWFVAAPGHYLLNPKACWGAAYYYNAEICPPGAHCPGEARHGCGSGYIQPEAFGLYVCGDNTYSDAGAIECTPCPVGTGNSGDNIADHAGLESCQSLPLCTAGATRLHAGSTSFNIWPNGKCASPALRIGLPDGVCCVNLAPGAGPGVNVRYNDNVYHTVNF